MDLQPVSFDELRRIEGGWDAVQTATVVGGAQLGGAIGAVAGGPVGAAAGAVAGAVGALVGIAISKVM